MWQQSAAWGVDVSASAPARLHFGLLNLSGLFGRVDGGVGIAVSRPRWELEVGFGAAEITGVPITREQTNALATALDTLACPLQDREVRIHIRQAIPCHVGLGSKTSLLLAAAAAVARLTNSNFSTVMCAERLGRGGTSGIGVHAFAHGGFIWDAGHSYPDDKEEFGPSSMQLAAPPPLVASFPVDWLSFIHFRFDDVGLHGAAEKQIFLERCPLDDEDSRQLLASVAGEMVPSLLERREEQFQVSLSRLQDSGLKRIEWSCQSDITKDFRAYWKRRLPNYALGLSSMGPTLFCLTSRPLEALEVVRSFSVTPVELSWGKIDNQGATVVG